MTYEQTAGQWFTPNGTSVTMAYRTPTCDWNTLQSCILEDEYGLRGLSLTGWALDVGGYLGAVGIVLALEHPDLQVVVVEPVPDNARLCRENGATNGVSDRVNVLEAAIGAPGQKTAQVAYAYTGSELAEVHAWVGNSTIVAATDCTVDTVPAFSLGEIMKLIGRTDPPSFVKIDCEGGEWQAFLDPLFRKVPLIVGEFHPTDGHGRKDVVRMLKSHDVVFSGPVSGPGGFTAIMK